MLIEAVKPLRVRFKEREVRLRPGEPIQFSEAEGQRLLEKAPDKVKVVSGLPLETPPTPPLIGLASHTSDIVIEPAPRNARLVYFERNDRQICGPARVLAYQRASAGGPQHDWLIVEFQGVWEWVWADHLRSRQQFECQRPLCEVDRIQERT